MRYPKGVPPHGRMGCCPDEWDSVPAISGLYTLDAVIKKNRNGDIKDRLATHCGMDQTTGRTAYNGYRGYTRGD